jgi:hypothetical protein
MYKTRYYRKLEKLYNPTPPIDTSNPGSYDYVFWSRGKKISADNCELFAKMREAYEVCDNCNHWEQRDKDSGVCEQEVDQLNSDYVSLPCTLKDFGCNLWEPKDD